jgi:DNA-binding beta-propeller fold protein YncE
MIRTSARMRVAIFTAALALPGSLTAQAFKVDRFNIGGEGRFDYLSADPESGHVYVSRSTHVMVVDGTTGKVVGDIPDTPGVHGIAFAPKSHHGFTTNGGDSTITMFDLKTLVVIKKIHTHTAGHDGIMFDDATGRIFAINHGRPTGSLTAIDAESGDVVGAVPLDGGGPEGGTGDGKGRIFINLEDKNEIQVVDSKTLKSIATWPLAPCDGPGGIAIDRPTMRIFSACGGSSIDVVVDSKSGHVVAQFPIGPGPDALGYDPSQKLIYTPGGGGRGQAGATPASGTVTIVHQDAPDKYTVIATLNTMRGARTIAVDPARHRAYVFTPEYGPAPTPAPDAPAPTGRGRGPSGPMLGAWLYVITH